jgi:DNA-directed RNA polymerase specialized sigma24 family protein
MLLGVARRSLGKHFGDEAEDVVQDFCIALVEKCLRFVPVRSDAIAWMRDVVRQMAKANRAERQAH